MNLPFFIKKYNNIQYLEQLYISYLFLNHFYIKNKNISELSNKTFIFFILYSQKWRTFYYILGLMNCFFNIVKLFNFSIFLNENLNRANQSSAYLKNISSLFLKKYRKNKSFFTYNSKKTMDLMRVKNYLHKYYASSNYLSKKLNNVNVNSTYNNLMDISRYDISKNNFISRRSIMKDYFIFCPFYSYNVSIQKKKIKKILNKQLIKNSKKVYLIKYTLKFKKNSKAKAFVKLFKKLKIKNLHKVFNYQIWSERESSLSFVKKNLTKVLVMSPLNLRNFTTLLDMFYWASKLILFIKLCRNSAVDLTSKDINFFNNYILINEEYKLFFYSFQEYVFLCDLLDEYFKYKNSVNSFDSFHFENNELFREVTEFIFSFFSMPYTRSSLSSNKVSLPKELLIKSNFQIKFKVFQPNKTVKIIDQRIGFKYFSELFYILLTDSNKKNTQVVDLRSHPLNLNYKKYIGRLWRSKKLNFTLKFFNLIFKNVVPYYNPLPSVGSDNSFFNHFSDGMFYNNLQLTFYYYNLFRNSIIKSNNEVNKNNSIEMPKHFMLLNYQLLYTLKDLFFTSNKNPSLHMYPFIFQNLGIVSPLNISKITESKYGRKPSSRKSFKDRQTKYFRQKSAYEWTIEDLPFFLGHTSKYEMKCFKKYISPSKKNVRKFYRDVSFGFKKKHYSEIKVPSGALLSLYSSDIFDIIKKNNQFFSLINSGVINPMFSDIAYSLDSSVHGDRNKKILSAAEAALLKENADTLGVKKIRKKDAIKARRKAKELKLLRKKQKSYIIRYVPKYRFIVQFVKFRNNFFCTFSQLNSNFPGGQRVIFSRNTAKLVDHFSKRTRFQTFGIIKKFLLEISNKFKTNTKQEAYAHYFASKKFKNKIKVKKARLNRKKWSKKRRILIKYFKKNKFTREDLARFFYNYYSSRRKKLVTLKWLNSRFRVPVLFKKTGFFVGNRIKGMKHFKIVKCRRRFNIKKKGSLDLENWIAFKWNKRLSTKKAKTFLFNPRVLNSNSKKPIKVRKRVLFTKNFSNKTKSKNSKKLKKKIESSYKLLFKIIKIFTYVETLNKSKQDYKNFLKTKNIKYLINYQLSKLAKFKYLTRFKEYSSFKFLYSLTNYNKFKKFINKFNIFINRYNFSQFKKIHKLNKKLTLSKFLKLRKSTKKYPRFKFKKYFKTKFRKNIKKPLRVNASNFWSYNQKYTFNKLTFNQQLKLYQRFKKIYNKKNIKLSKNVHNILRHKNLKLKKANNILKKITKLKKILNRFKNFEEKYLLNNNDESIEVNNNKQILNKFYEKVLNNVFKLQNKYYNHYIKPKNISSLNKFSRNLVKPIKKKSTKKRRKVLPKKFIKYKKKKKYINKFQKNKKKQAKRIFKRNKYVLKRLNYIIFRMKKRLHKRYLRFLFTTRTAKPISKFPAISYFTKSAKVSILLNKIIKRKERFNILFKFKGSFKRELRRCIRFIQRNFKSLYFKKQFHINRKKAFNGCRLRKVRRKKRIARFMSLKAGAR